MNFKEEAIKMLEEGREVYPLHDIDGNITGVTGRLTLKKDLSVPTYVVRGTGFFGNLDTERNEIIITEGIMDVLTAQAYKYDNVISCLHAANWKKVFTDDVLTHIAAMNKKIIIFFDNDELGQRNAKALRTKMEEYGIDVYNFQSDWAKDMTEYLMLSTHSIEDIIYVSKNIFKTGTFAILKNSFYRKHKEDDEFDDDVLPRLTEREKTILHGEIDGYVTNVGTEVTIHIKPELNTKNNIERVKRDFGLTENNKRITKIIIEETDIAF